MVDTVFAAVRMPSSPFIQVDKFAAIAGGKIYIGKPDTDPTVPANQVQVHWEQEDLTLVAVPQPIMINASGYPVYQGTAGRFVTQTGCSMAVYNRLDVLQYYFDNLLEYDAAQMWKVIQSPTGWEYIGTDTGTLKDQIRGWVTPWDFVGKPAYTTTSAAIQAMFDHALSTGKIVNAYGWTGTLESTVNSGKIKVMGGTWKGTADWRLTDTELQGAVINNLRVAHYGGDVKIHDCLFDGKPTSSKVASIMMQSIPTEANTIEVYDTTFRNGIYGILQQGSAVMQSGVYRNLAFYDMAADAIELNVVQRSYDNGCLIDGIFIDTIDSTDQAPISPSNWGIGIGVAGQSPYGLDTPDSNFAKNVAIRNVYANKVRQVVHFEMVRDSTIENIHADPNQNVSNGSGLILACVLCYGSRRVSIDGVYGEPVVTGTTQAQEVRIVMLEWGTNAGVGARGPCQDMSIRNVYSKTGRFYAGVGTQQAGYSNTYQIENINVAKFSVFGVATELNIANVHCRVFDCVGDDAAAGTPTTGYVPTGRTILRMVNVTATDVNGYADQGWSRCSYSQIESIGSNVFARMYPMHGIDGAIGVELGNSNQTYLIPDAETMNAAGIWDGNAFPTGREFMEGDIVVRNDGKIFVVTVSGAYIPAIDEFKIKATTVGSKVIASNYPLSGNKGDMVWIYKTPLTPGTRIVIPGAGDGGPLSTWITKAPYRVDTSNPTSEIRIEIADPIVTATAAGVNIAAAKPITFRTPT